MEYQGGDNLGRAICELLGINPEYVVSLKLECRVHEMPKVTIQQIALTSEEKLHQFADVIKHYEIREVRHDI